jgi:hypothetical protein
MRIYCRRDSALTRRMIMDSEGCRSRRIRHAEGVSPHTVRQLRVHRYVSLQVAVGDRDRLERVDLIKADRASASVKWPR